LVSGGHAISAVSTTYGLLLSAKVALFLFMALLASANRFWLTPKLIDFPHRGPGWPGFAFMFWRTSIGP